jgi:hypothetical protein
LGVAPALPLGAVGCGACLAEQASYSVSAATANTKLEPRSFNWEPTRTMPNCDVYAPHEVAESIGPSDDSMNEQQHPIIDIYLYDCSRH